MIPSNIKVENKFLHNKGNNALVQNYYNDLELVSFIPYPKIYEHLSTRKYSIGAWTIKKYKPLNK